MSIYRADSFEILKDSIHIFNKDVRQELNIFVLTNLSTYIPKLNKHEPVQFYTSRLPFRP